MERRRGKGTSDVAWGVARLALHRLSACRRPQTLLVCFAVLNQVNLVVGDMAPTLAFYRRLGFRIDTPSADHAVAELADGNRVEVDSREFTAVWDSSYSGTTGGSTILGPGTETRDDVDELYAERPSEDSRKFWSPSAPPRTRHHPVRTEVLRLLREGP